MLDELVEVERLGPGREDLRVVVVLSELDTQVGDVVDEHRLNAVAAVARDAEYRQSAQRPGHVVDEDVAGSVEERGSDDRVS